MLGCHRRVAALNDVIEAAGIDSDAGIVDGILTTN